MVIPVTELRKQAVYAREVYDDPEELLLNRMLARKSFLDFVTFTYPGFHVDTLQVVIGAYLEKVISGEIKKLMVFAPPQHGKSELISVRLPAYWFAQRPDDPVLLCSYVSSLAQDKAAQIRGLINSPVYESLFPDLKISKRTRANSSWRIARRQGKIFASGVGGSITGHGAALGIIDDPHKNIQEAESINARERVWKWYQTTFRTRIWTKGAIILVMTRWHEDDLAGRLLNDQGKEWEVVRLPAIAETDEEWDETSEYLHIPWLKGLQDMGGREPGEAICPSRYDLESLANLRIDIGPLAWAAQYSGAPRAPGGNVIKRDWFPIIDPSMLPKEFVAIIRFWDKAATQDGGCRTAGVLIGKDRAGMYYIIDVVKGQWSTYNREKIIQDTAAEDRKNFGLVTIGIEEEGGSGGIDSARATVMSLDGYTVVRDRPSGGKLTRLGPFMGQAEAGHVSIVKGAWNWDYLNELTALPVSEFWDQADATSGAFNRLATFGWSRGPRRK